MLNTLVKTSLAAALSVTNSAVAVDAERGKTSKNQEAAMAITGRAVNRLKPPKFPAEIGM